MVKNILKSICYDNELGQMIEYVYTVFVFGIYIEIMNDWLHYVTIDLKPFWWAVHWTLMLLPSGEM